MKQRIYTISNSVHSRLKTLTSSNIDVGRIDLSLEREGEELASWSTDANGLTKTLQSKFKVNSEATEVILKVYDTHWNLQIEGTYLIYPDRKPKNIPNAGNHLAGPASTGQMQQVQDLGALVEEKVQQIRQAEELDRLRSEQVELKAKNEELLGQVETLEAQIEAKSNLEYYSKVAGDLLPGIAKALEKTSLGPALSGLAGEQTEKDDQTTVLDSTKALIEALSEEQLSAFYMLVLELQNNPALIPALYQNAFSNETQH